MMEKVHGVLAATGETADRRAVPAKVLAWSVERPILVVFLLALLVRSVAAVVITVGWGGSLFPDDASYSRLAAAVADGQYGALDEYSQWLYERTGTLLVPVTGLYEMFGPVKLGGQLYVALLGATTAALTARLALELVSRRWALVAGALVAFIPSQILWSSLILKDAAVWAILSALAVVVAVAGRTSSGRRLALLGVAAVGLLVLLGFLRLHTLEVALVALWITMAVQALLRAPRPRLRVATATVIAAGIPLLFGMGLFGASFVRDSRDPTVQRALNARDAKSAAVSPSRSDGSLPTATDAEDESISAGGELSYLPKGITVVALRPWPWEASRGSIGVRLAQIEALLWYPLVLLALVGLTTIRRRIPVLAFPLLTGGAILMMYGLTEGNLGTAFRHRGEFVWIVLLLATLGLERLWRRRRVGRPARVTGLLEPPHRHARPPIPAHRP
jgi:hypothetical protein